MDRGPQNSGYHLSYFRRCARRAAVRRFLESRVPRWVQLNFVGFSHAQDAPPRIDVISKSRRVRMHCKFVDSESTAKTENCIIADARTR